MAAERPRAVGDGDECGGGGGVAVLWDWDLLKACPIAVNGREVDRKGGPKGTLVVLLLIMILGGTRWEAERSDENLDGARGRISHSEAEEEEGEDDGKVSGSECVLEDMAGGATRARACGLAPVIGDLACC
jgi:hypothetical protein